MTWFYGPRVCLCIVCRGDFVGGDIVRGDIVRGRVCTRRGELAGGRLCRGDFAEGDFAGGDFARGRDDWHRMPDTSRRQRMRLPPCPRSLPWCPWNAPVEIYRPHRVLHTKVNMTWCPCPFKNKAYLPGPNFIELLSITICLAWNVFLDKNRITSQISTWFSG